MLFSAANLVVALVAGQASSLGHISSVGDGLLYLGPAQSPSGVAVQISQDGFFLASSSVAPTLTVPARSRGGRGYTLRVIARDDITQLSLLSADDWKTGDGRVVSVASADAVATQKLIAVLPTGTVTGELVSQNRTGILQSSRRYVRLWEVRLESTSQRLGGAPVFTIDGRLGGILNATLEPVGVTERDQLAIQKLNTSPDHFGPRGLTVGYALGPKVLNRVVSGFLSPDRTALHPTVGVLFKSLSKGGVELTSVTAGSAAARAGLKVGDELTTLDGEPIRDAFGLAASLFESEIGDDMKFEVTRMGGTFTLSVRVESLAEARRGRENVPKELDAKTFLRSP